MRVGLGRHFGKLVDDMFGRGAVGIAHAEVDNVLAPCPCGGLHRIHFGEDVGRKALDSVEFVGHGTSMAAVLHCGKRTRAMTGIAVGMS